MSGRQNLSFAGRYGEYFEDEANLLLENRLLYAHRGDDFDHVVHINGFAGDLHVGNGCPWTRLSDGIRYKRTPALRAI
jgi:hypothetical protein